VLEEQPSAPRFGLDVATAKQAPEAGAPALASWNELSWSHVATAPAAGDGPRHLALAPAPRERPAGASWGASAAEMAWITLQLPYRVYIHGSSMLRDSPAPPARTPERP